MMVSRHGTVVTSASHESGSDFNLDHDVSLLNYTPERDDIKYFDVVVASVSHMKRFILTRNLITI